MNRLRSCVGLSRREFARRAALAAAVAAALPRELLAQAAAPAQPDTSGTPVPGAAETAVPPLPPASQAEAEARIEAILHRRGDRLSPEQRAEVRRLVLASQPGLDTLRAYPLANADEPATVLHVRVRGA